MAPARGERSTGPLLQPLTSDWSVVWILQVCSTFSPHLLRLFPMSPFVNKRRVANFLFVSLTDHLGNLLHTIFALHTESQLTQTRSADILALLFHSGYLSVSMHIIKHAYAHTVCINVCMFMHIYTCTVTYTYIIHISNTGHARMLKKDTAELSRTSSLGGLWSVNSGGRGH